MFQLYSYQKAAKSAVFSYFRQGKKGNPLVVLPTGSGKTHVIASICQELHQRAPGKNILIISHVKEILLQDYEKLCAYLPDEHIGLYSSGLNQREIKTFTVAGIQSIYRHGARFQDTALIIVDEAHLIPPAGEGRYQTFFDALPNTPILGFTATPFRMGFGYLTDERHLFSKVVYEAKVAELIKLKYLCQLQNKEAKEQMDVSKVKIVAGEYSSKSLSQEFDRTTLTNVICEELVKYKDTKKHWLIFAIDIAHAEHVANMLSEFGVTALAVHSKLSATERDTSIRLFRDSKVTALINVETLTTGFDYPEIDMIVLLRPTRSPVLHCQMIGRGLRKHDSKDYTLVLDFAGNLKRIGPIDKIEIEPTAGKGGGVAPVKTCPECDEVLPLHEKVCLVCGFEFKQVEKLTLTASSAALLAEDATPILKELDVRSVYYHKHEKKAAPASLKVSYVCGNGIVYNEWIIVESLNNMRFKAEHWWNFRSGTKLPRTVADALLAINQLYKPKTITVDSSGKYPKIVKFKFQFPHGDFYYE